MGVIPMQHFEIITEQTSIDVRFDPHLPGIGVRATGLAGFLRGSVDDEGKIDVSRPIAGGFNVAVGDFDLGNRLITYVMRKWLGDQSDLMVRGRLGGFRSTSPGSFEATVVSELKGRDFDLSASGSFVQSEADSVSLKGLTRLHPRDVGIPLPRFGIPHVHVHWDIALRLTR